MRPKLTALFILFTGTFGLRAQDCSIPFTMPLFGVQVESDLWYGNATRFNGSIDSLRLNLYKPVGDGQTERPLLVVIHGGGFIDGDRNELNDYCNTVASMGWAAATISYRLGLYGTGILDPPYAYDPNEMRRALYRAMQDAKGAIRFLKDRHEQDSTSTTNVLLVGFSAGAITALHAAYLDRPEEKPASANAIGDVQHFFNFYPRPDLGDIDGDLNQNGSDASVLGVVNIFGALLDTAYIESADDPALYSYHQTLDPVVGCGYQRPYWGVGLGVQDNNPYLHGSCNIDLRMQNLGPAPGHYLFNLHNGNAHDVHDPAGVLLQSLLWMRALFCGPGAGMDDITPISALELFPNPTSGPLNIEHSMAGPLDLEIRDALGQLMWTGVLQHHDHPVDVGFLTPGMYLLRGNADGRYFVERFVVAR